MPGCLALPFGAALSLEVAGVLVGTAFALHFGFGVGCLAAGLFSPVVFFLEAMVW